MSYKDFVSRAIQQDARNVFAASDKVPDIVPQSLRKFYNEYNPVDVEIDTKKYGAIRFYGIDELERLREEYYFYPKDVFIFATSNGDPFFMGEDNQVYTSLESEYSPEKVADNFTAFLESCLV
ncbi:SMI1/KNR4 family protein [Bacteroides caecicola]|uniref:SMI1/KNR4 family protein n=1 Tax=Bacteroides caecicola TaxID=1462569 RepID=UPI002010CFD3|nr:SMI1/KNR4 family protein [Bacteroides caecicola]MCL1626158.1 SMI1/KNR4 family protein [Bacteroides caecicola]